ncbi:Adhesin Hia [Canicola haemoglobinophilus]|uniref:Adhesin Hia n=1 Tax=Canicola haemoglobinophilus TaxID=733 RepID=A0AB38HA61_9PAST|nr:YadA-like family protein [Canicola haemoglobinophilus]STO53622.1 Adhesin Hia [Canicola haemoglobinophilus]STO68156.1 Adhesin Hia [Canicola haemoglobinophilus]
MNKIFKVIWNHTTQTWIAVSELGKSKTKSKSQTNTTINLSKSLGLISLGTFGVAGTVLGAATADPITYDGTTATPANTLYVTTSDKHVLVGKTAQGGNDHKMNRDEEIVSIGFNTKASGRQTIAIGSNATAAPGQTSDGAAFSNWGESIAIGHNANANAHRGVAIGPDATVEGYPGSVAVGASAKVIGEYGTAVGLSAKTQGHYDIAIGYSASTYNLDKNGKPVPHNQSAYNLAVGVDAHAKNGFSTAVGRQAKSVNQANAFGYLANASGVQSVAVGTKARAIGNNSAAFGYSATAKGWGDIALGLEAKATPNAGGGATALGQSARAFGKESGAIGFGNIVGMTPPAALPTDPTELKTLQDSGLGSFAVGARNNITGIGTFVLGYGVTVNTSSSVVLGDSSSQTGSHIVENVTSATVTGISYSGFAGKVRDVGRFVSIGAPDSNGRVNQRKIINMAAGKIESNSTEAINGSQLYLTHKAINDVNNNIPFDYTHKDDDKPLVRLGDKYYKEEDIANLTYDPNTNTFKDNNGRRVTPTAVPENKVNITVKGEPKTVENIAGNLAPTYNKGDLKEGGTDDKPNGQLTDNISPAYTQRATKPSPEEMKKIYNNAATVGDVLNSGWNLSLNGDSQIDFVKPYDTVNFANGKGTLASVETKDGKVSNVTFNIDNGTATALESGALQGTSPEEKANLEKAVKDAEKAAADVKTKETELTKAKEALAAVPEGENNNQARQEAQAKVDEAQNALAEAKAKKANKDSLKAKADRDLLAVDNKVATVENVVSAVNKSGFTIYQDEATDGNKKALVNPGDKVVYAAEGLATVTVDKETDAGVTKITYKVDAQAVAETAQLPVVYTDKDGNKLIKGDDGKFYPADSVKIDGKYYPKGSAKDGDVVKKDGQPATELQPKATGDVIASMNNAAGSTTNPMALTNIASNLSPVDTKVVFTETGVPVANPFNGKSAPALSKALENPDSPLRNNAATIGDVLNAGWNLQGNGEAKDFVRHTDTVNFVNGVGTTVSVTTDDKQKVSEIRVNSLVGLTAQDGTPVIKGDDNKFYKVDAEGKPNKAQPVEASDLVANVINPAAAAPNKKGDPLQLGNIAAGAKTFDNEVGGNLGSDPVTLANDGKWYPADQVEATGKPKADATAIPAPKGDNNIKAGLIDFNNSNPNNALTVEDARNLGWIVSTSDNGYADQVRNANKVNFKGKDGISVTGETNADGVREITITLKKGEVVKSNEFSVTKEGADKPINVIKVGDQYFNKDDIDPTTGKPIEGKKPVKVDETKDKVENKGEDFVTGNTVAEAIQKSGFTVGKATDTATVDFNNKDEKVNPDDNLRFADGKGTSVSLGTVKELDKAGNIQTTTVVKVDVDTAKISDNPNGSVKGSFATPEAKASAQKEVEKAAKDLTDAQTKYEKAVKDLTAATTPEAKLAKAQELVAATTALNKADKALADASKPFNKVATVENVVDAINNSGFTLKASAVENKGKLETGTADKTKGELINPGKTVEMIAGKNMSVKHDKNGQITYATKDDVNFDSVQFGDNGPKIQRDGDNIKVSNSTGGPTKITNVAPGTADTDAVNVKQLKEAVGNINNNFGDINNRVNKLDKRMRGIGANVAAAASLPQVYIPGKSMISAAAGGYNGASAVAVGYSRASDNGKLILKLTGTANSTGQYSGGVGVGYQW